MKWWFLHFSPGQFREGLLFAGYYVFNLSFLLPLLHYIRKKTPLSMTLGAISVSYTHLISSALSMLDQGAGSDTKTELESALGIKELSDWNNEMQSYLNKEWSEQTLSLIHI